jgi:hypothetical protein
MDGSAGGTRERQSPCFTLSSLRSTPPDRKLDRTGTIQDRDNPRDNAPVNSWLRWYGPFGIGHPLYSVARLAALH